MGASSQAAALRRTLSARPHRHIYARSKKNERSPFFPYVSPTATEKGTATRELILGRAYELAQELGLEGLSIGTVAISAGMSKSGVFAHFGSCEQL